MRPITLEVAPAARLEVNVTGGEWPRVFLLERYETRSVPRVRRAVGGRLGPYGGPHALLRVRYLDDAAQDRRRGGHRREALPRRTRAPSRPGWAYPERLRPALRHPDGRRPAHRDGQPPGPGGHPRA